MTTFSAGNLKDDWPLHGLEKVCSCPYCGGIEKTLTYQDVQDWSFACADGRWSYWRCGACHSLYLDPRPTASTIGDAYGRYYTHAPARQSLLDGIRQRLKNEYWSLLFDVNIRPRLGMPRWSAPLFSLLDSSITEPFGLRQMAQLPRGFLIDVGCGNGNTLKSARQLGWQVLGIEMDASAVKAAQAEGLNVIQESYEALELYEGKADCIVCSHVLEHVHHPLRLLRLLLAALKPAGVLLLSAPNASSHLRDHYGENWRGLEAPRHLALPDAAWLMNWLRSQELACIQVPSGDRAMMIESERIRRRAATSVKADAINARNVARTRKSIALDNQDIVQIVCTKPAT